MSDAVQRMQVLTGSLRCFVLGWLSLVPLLGLPFGAWAVVLFWKTRQRSLGYPNPARVYLGTGLVLAALGLLLTGVTAMCVNVAIYHAYFEGLF
jgi:hypothetical protein